MDEEEKELLRGKASDGKMACPVALAFAKEHGISPKEVGQALNEMKIKIVGCQLGCFQ